MSKRRMSSPVHADLRPNTLQPSPAETDNQDVNDPQWYPNFTVPAVADPDGSSLESVRRNDGHLDLLHTIAEDVKEWWEDGEDKPATWPPGHAKPIVIPVQVQAANSWRGNTYTVPAQGVKVESRDDRVRVLITNWGANPVYVSHQSLSDYAGVVAGQVPANVVQIPPPGGAAAGITVAANVREFRHKGELWIYPTAASVPVVDVQDEYGTA